MEILSYYDNVFEAEVARGKLESEGIMAIVQNENLGNILPLGGAIQSLRPYILVRDEDLLQAAGILGIAISEARDFSKCPACGSDKVSFRFFYKDKPIRAFMYFAMLPLFFAAMHPGNVRRAYNCRACGQWF